MSRARFFGWTLVALCGLFALPREAHALRCNDRVVVSGDHAFEVQARCGEPYWIETFDEVLVAGEDSALEQRVQRRYEAWYYNFGPNQLMRRLLFLDNRLMREDTLGYGYRTLAQRCNLDQITRGLTTGEIVARCGLPSNRDTRYQELIVRNGAGFAQRRLIRVDEWLYPEGRRDPYLLRFNDGRLEAIDRIDR